MQTEYIIGDLFNIYKEIYADVVSHCVFKYDMRAFFEGLDVSRGTNIRSENEPFPDTIRAYIMAILWDDDKQLNISEYEGILGYLVKRGTEGEHPLDAVRFAESSDWRHYYRPSSFSAKTDNRTFMYGAADYISKGFLDESNQTIRQ